MTEEIQILKRNSISVMATHYNRGGIPAAAASEEELQKSPILIPQRITTPSNQRTEDCMTAVNRLAHM